MWDGLGRFRLPGLPEVNMEALLNAAGQKLNGYSPGEDGGAARSPVGPLGSSSRRSRTC